ncbi:hypothetical protein DXG01_008165 [Tephrocybe rancida]|nr:hypothetical protein DXG01_008165 [Tephrocybe rancida]
MAAVSAEEYSDPPSPTPHSAEDTRLLPMNPPSTSPVSSTSSPSQSTRPSRAVSTASFVSSPLNPTYTMATSPASPPPPSSPSITNPFSSTRSSRPGSRASHLDLAPHIHAHHRDTTYSLAAPSSYAPGTGLGMAGLGGGHRGSMLLYRLAGEEDLLPPAVSASSRDSAHLIPPPKFGGNRDSTMSSSGASIASLDSKYPLSHSNRDSAFPTAPRGLVPYEYDPAMDELDPIDDEDLLHDPKSHGIRKTRFPWRGVLNVTVLMTLILALLCLFIFYPVLSFFRTEARNSRINGNIRINATGQAPQLFQMPELIDPATPQEALTRTGFDAHEYSLVFSDEFTQDGRSFYPGDDPFWEAVDLWYGSTGDVEWYDPSQVTTRDGHLVITMDSTATLQAGLTKGSTAPFSAAENHGLEYRSGMLQSWNKFCFTSGYIEVAVVLPGPNAEATGYWPGAWTMGNLARPGYSATTDGMWPYTRACRRGECGRPFVAEVLFAFLWAGEEATLDFVRTRWCRFDSITTFEALLPTPLSAPSSIHALPSPPKLEANSLSQRYNSCDVGTFPNQTNKDGLGPAAALHSDNSRSKYNFELSWLSGQRVRPIVEGTFIHSFGMTCRLDDVQSIVGNLELMHLSRSACSCPNSDHPGPSTSVGRGAPEIDIFEAEHAKDTPTGQVVSQSAQFAPFTADYQYGTATADQWEIFTPNVTRPNSYKGSAVQQAVSGLVSLRDDMFQGSGGRLTTLGGCYFSRFRFFVSFGDPPGARGALRWRLDHAPCSFRITRLKVDHFRPHPLHAFIFVSIHPPACFSILDSRARRRSRELFELVFGMFTIATGALVWDRHPPEKCAIDMGFVERGLETASRGIFEIGFSGGGFEYWGDPSAPSDGYITWQVDGVQSHRLGASAVGPDQGPTGSGVGQRLIPLEPMSIVLNLGMSPNWQTIDLSTLVFPAEMLIDYVRVYQRKGVTNVGCSPRDFPTKDYIDNHMDAYTNVNTTTWNWVKPKNSLYDGC